jgi:hypothetical protein
MRAGRQRGTTTTRRQRGTTVGAPAHDAAQGAVMIEIRRNEDGTVDEVVTPTFHLEQMDDGHWWMRIMDGEEAVVVQLATSRGRAKIHCIAEMD